ncbi:hypothetical protein, partial [Phenylobacterium sp.]|uniref:hypothetical protein n=1 Tax=Phenylobacterium sp. TaxID=1871053 RepID=UPI00286C8DF2
VAAEIAAERQARSQALRSAERHRGVCWSGLGSDAYRPRGRDALEAEAAAKLARRKAWRDSPSGAFLNVISGMQVAAKAAHDAGERAREACSRSAQAEAATCAAAAREIEVHARTLLAGARSARRAALRLAAPSSDQREG